MSLPHALLGLIQYKPATGYDLKAAFQKSITFFWNAALPHIYRTLKQMEGQGWIISVTEHQEGKPSRKVYQSTAAGKQELRRWLAEPPDRPEPRLPMLVKVFFGNQMPSDQLKQHLKDWRDDNVRLLKTYEQDTLPVIRRKAAKTDLLKDAIYWNMTLDFGRRQARMVVEWCDQAIKELEAVQGKKK